MEGSDDRAHALNRHVGLADSPQSHRNPLFDRVVLVRPAAAYRNGHLPIRIDVKQTLAVGNVAVGVDPADLMLDGADSTLYVNKALMLEEEHLSTDAHFIDHGVDFKHFASARTLTGLPTGEVPIELQELARPIIGFYGALDDYTIDLELMEKVAQQLPAASLVIIGPKAMDIDSLLEYENVHYLGPVSYSQLPRYAACFDVAIMPWLQNEWIKSCNPIKLKEYLALGFPIVSTPFPQLEAFADCVQIGRTHEEFVRLVSKLTTADRNSEEEIKRAGVRRESVRSDSWEAIANRVLRVVGYIAPGDSV